MILDLKVGKIYELQPKKFPEHLTVVKILSNDKSDYECLCLASWEKDMRMAEVTEWVTNLSKSFTDWSKKELSRTDLLLYVSCPCVNPMLADLLKEGHHALVDRVETQRTISKKDVS